MTFEIIAPVVGILVGLFCLAGGIKNWDWFMQAYNARQLVSLTGRRGARVFYVVVGLVFCAGSIQMLVSALSDPGTR